MKLEELEEIAAAGEAVGFARIQFTGGEPLLHPQIVEFVSTVRSRFDDVGITTNGVYLSSKITELASVGLNRLHVSLMVEPLQDAGTSPGEWGIPKWVERICEICASKGIALRFNLPVPRNHFHNASEFMARMRSHAAQLKVFSMLPEGACREEEFPIEFLRDIVNRENSERVTLGLDTRVELRDYRPPVGIRCRCCPDYGACKEQSHSLRVGSDKVLRPCLATRQWDISLGNLENLAEHIESATLFALDY
jgi:molybdenum cofactor biosynthesis enzyme MoaA